jgi:acyl carrier protein
VLEAVMHASATTAQQLRQILAEEADDFPVGQITSSTTLRRDLNLSGLQLIALAYRLEAEFSIEFDDADAAAMSAPSPTVGDLMAAIERHLTTKGNPE